MQVKQRYSQFSFLLVLTVDYKIQQTYNDIRRTRLALSKERAYYKTTYRVRLHTNAAKRLRRRDNALYLVFKIVERLSRHWRPLNGVMNLMALVLGRRSFQRRRPAAPRDTGIGRYNDLIKSRRLEGNFHKI